MIRNLIFGIAICLVTAGCGDMLKGKSSAESQVAAFHEKWNAGHFDEIYSTADEAYRFAFPKDAALQSFSILRKDLGKVKSCSTKKWEVRTVNSVTTAALVVESEFEQGKVPENFIFRISDGKASLVGYYLGSNNVMTQLSN